MLRQELQRLTAGLIIGLCLVLVLLFVVAAEAVAESGDLLASIANPNLAAASTDYFGYSIAKMGSSFVVGVYNDDPGGVLNTGSVYQFNADTFDVIRKIPNPVPQSQAQFGKSVVGFGNNFAVATAFNEEENRIYYFDGTTGMLSRTIVPPPGKYFGGFSADAITLAAGQGRLWVQGAGNVMAFDPADGNMVLEISPATSDIYFGQSIAPNGDNIVIAGLKNIYVYGGGSGELLSTIPSPANVQLTEMTVTPAGHVFAAYRDGTAYLFDGVSREQLLRISDPTPDHTFCCNVAAAGNALILGNKGYNGSEGIAYMFDANTGELVRTIHNPSGSGAASSGDYFGESLFPFGEDVMIGVIQADSAHSTPARRWSCLPF